MKARRRSPWLRCVPLNSTWNPRLELDSATIPWNYSIREFQKGNAHYVAVSLEQPLLLLKDIAALKNVRQLDLFLSLKRDLALVSFLTCLLDFMLGWLELFFIGLVLGVLQIATLLKISQNLFYFVHNLL